MSRLLRFSTKTMPWVTEEIDVFCEGGTSESIYGDVGVGFANYFERACLVGFLKN